MFGNELDINFPVENVLVKFNTKRAAFYNENLPRRLEMNLTLIFL